MPILGFNPWFMEDIIKFGFYAVIGIIYIVSQLRKAKNKQAEEQRGSDFDPTLVIGHKPVKVQTVQKNKPVTQQEDASNYRSVRKLKPLLKAKIAEVPKVKVEYKTLDMFDVLEDEDSKVKRILEERRVEESVMRKDRTSQTEEHLHPYVASKEQKKLEHVSWFHKKNSLKQAFIASEIFNRKY